MDFRIRFFRTLSRISRMRIGIDARFYGTLGKGLGRYVSELIRHLEETDHENEYVVFLRKENFDEYTPAYGNFTKVLAEFPWYGLREQLFFPILLRRFKLDLMHFGHFNVPMLYRRPFVVTIHDLILLKHPTPRASTLGPLLFRLKFLFYRMVITNALKRAREIITVSDCTKNDLRETFPFTKNKKITVTHLACAPSFLDNKPTDTLPDLPKPYILYVGNAYPHKNLERLVRAFGLFRKGHPEFHLVLVGAEDHFYRRLKADTAKVDPDGHVRFFGRATDAELAAIYANASFYAFPSLHEGFGLPPLEAMCKGLPVMAAEATCLPEILGDAAIYFDPSHVKDIAIAMRKLADDDVLRENLRTKGHARTSVFDWATCARKTLDVYRHALDQLHHA